MQPLVQLETTGDDDVEFVGLVARCVTGCLQLSGSSAATVVHIDNWFGDRWLGFEGKILGAAGYRSKVGDDSRARVTVPPFHPHRVVSEWGFEIRGGEIFPIVQSRMLHGRRTSEENMRLTLERVTGPGVIAWYSGNTKVNRRGSLMVYVLTTDGASGWYAAFEQSDSWRVNRRIGISETEWQLIANPTGFNRD